MTAPPGRWCCRGVELAVRVLPSEHRARYGLEFVAELYGLPPAQQRRHAARVSCATQAPSASECSPVGGSGPEAAVP